MLPRLGSHDKPMKKEEQAIIHTLNVGGEDVTVSKFYGTTVDMSAHSLKIRTRKKLQMGGNVEVMLNLEGHRKPFFLSGVITGMELSTDGSGYLIHISLNQQNQKNDTSIWKKLFH